MQNRLICLVMIFIFLGSVIGTSAANPSTSSGYAYSSDNSSITTSGDTAKSTSNNESVSDSNPEEQNREIVENETGKITVRTKLPLKLDSDFSSDDVIFTISGPETYSGNGSHWGKTDAPAGTYTINYEPVSGYQTPSSETKILTAGDSITFIGNYNYTLKKKVGGILGFGGDDLGFVGDWDDLDFGDRDVDVILIKQIDPEKNEVLIEFAITPLDIDESLMDSNPEEQNREIVENETGYISVDTKLSFNPDSDFSSDDTTFTISGPKIYSGSGSYWEKTGASAGTYTINYEPVSGYQTPSSETKILTAGDSITFFGGYNSTLNKKVGDTLDFGDCDVIIKQIDPEKNEVLMDIVDKSGEMDIVDEFGEGISVHTELPFNPDSDYTLDDKIFTISGPETYSGDGSDWEKTDAPVGTYTINYEPVSGYQTPFPETKTLNAGGSIDFLGIYTLKKKVGESLDFGDGYIALIKQVDPEKNAVLIERRLDGRIIGEEIIKKGDVIDAGKESYSLNEGHDYSYALEYISRDGNYIYLSWPGMTMPGVSTVMTVTSNPGGADIKIDGDYRGKTPRSIPVSDLEKHSIRLELAGYDNWEEEYKFEDLTEDKNIKAYLNKTSSPTVQPRTTPASTVQPGTTSALKAQPETTSASTAQPGTTSSSTAQPGTTSSSTVQPGTTSSSTVQPGTTSSSTAQPEQHHLQQHNREQHQLQQHNREQHQPQQKVHQTFWESQP